MKRQLKSWIIPKLNICDPMGLGQCILQSCGCGREFWGDAPDGNTAVVVPIFPSLCSRSTPPWALPHDISGPPTTGRVYIPLHWLRAFDPENMGGSRSVPVPSWGSRRHPIMDFHQCPWSQLQLACRPMRKTTYLWCYKKLKFWDSLL